MEAPVKRKASLDTWQSLEQRRRYVMCPALSKEMLSINRKKQVIPKLKTSQRRHSSPAHCPGHAVRPDHVFESTLFAC